MIILLSVCVAAFGQIWLFLVKSVSDVLVCVLCPRQQSGWKNTSIKVTSGSLQTENAPDSFKPCFTAALPTAAACCNILRMQKGSCSSLPAHIWGISPCLRRFNICFNAEKEILHGLTVVLFQAVLTNLG